jgi:Cytochrome C and Quinol oxidase polypeptide I
VTWFKLRLFVWPIYATSIILVLATPVLAITLLLMAVERSWKVGILNPAIGGDPLLFRHLFWFYCVRVTSVWIQFLLHWAAGKRKSTEAATAAASTLERNFKQNVIGGFRTHSASVADPCQAEVLQQVLPYLDSLGRADPDPFSQRGHDWGPGNPPYRS